MRSAVLILAMLLTATLLAVVVANRMVQDAQAERQAAKQRRDEASRLVAQLVELRGHSGSAAVAASRRPDADLVKQVEAALQQQGLPLGAFKGVEGRGDQNKRHGMLRLQQVQVRLEGLRPQELGNFLAAWNQAGSPWSINQLQLAHTRAPAAAPASTRRSPARHGRHTAAAAVVDQNRYDCTLLLAAPYVDAGAQDTGGS